MVMKVHMDTLSSRELRKQTAYQFELQAARLQFTILARHSNYRYKLYDERHLRELIAIVVPESFDFYRLRLNRGEQKVDMVICRHHNCILPVRCVSMEESHEYGVHSLPRNMRSKRARRNSDEVNLLVSQLLLGVKKAYAELATMPDRTRQRYLARRDLYLRPRMGRPWKS
jgi:hypothetical protein